MSTLHSRVLGVETYAVTDSMALDAHELERFFALVDVRGDDECWPFEKIKVKSGYGQFTVRRDREPGERRWTTFVAHRVMWFLVHNEVPETIDHVCHTQAPWCRLGPKCPHRCCVNPAHLENVPAAENLRRAVATGRTGGLTTSSPKTHCAAGHPYAGDNLKLIRGMNGNVHRDCRECWRRRDREGRRRRNPPKPKRSIDRNRYCKWCLEVLTVKYLKHCNDEHRMLWILNDKQNITEVDPEIWD